MRPLLKLFLCLIILFSSLTIDQALANETLTLTANPRYISANGTSTSTLTADIDIAYGASVSGYWVHFWIDQGTGTISPEYVQTNSSGVATTTYRSSTTPGEVLLKAEATVQIPPDRGGGTRRVWGMVKVWLVKVEMKLEKVGTTAIESTNTYSENTTIRVTAVDATTGNTCSWFTGTVNIAEDGTSIYNQNGGNLPSSVVISSGGTTTFVAKSIVGPKTNFIAPPDPAKIKTTNYSVYGGTPLSVDQWVDTNSNNRVDWCEQWSNALLTGYQGIGGEVQTVTSKCTGISTDSYGTYYGYMDWDTTVIHLNPAAPNHRTNAASELENTVLHETRHVFQSWETNQNSIGGVNAVDNEHDPLEDPNNDDDPTLWGDGDYLPELVTFASENNPNGIRDGVDVGSGDGVKDDYATVASPAIEGDAAEFANAYD